MTMQNQSMETKQLIVHVRLEDFYEDLAGDVEQRFNISNYEVKRSLLIGTDKKVNRVNEG